MKKRVTSIYRQCSISVFLNIGIPLVFILILATSSFSCKKTGPAEAVITVQDSFGKPVAGATVVLRQDTVKNANGVQASIYEKKISDSQGNASFSFKWEAVLNVEAKKGLDSGSTYIRLEQSKTVPKTVVIK